MKRVGIILLLMSMWGTLWANTTLDELTALEKNKTTLSSIDTATHRPTQPTPSSFVQSHVLVVFFSSTCHFCQGFVPVAKQWAESEQWQVIPITTNGASLPTFPHPIPIDAEIKAHYYAEKPVVVPACFVLNIKTHQAYPVSIGALTLAELNERMNMLLPKIETYEKGVHA